MKIVLTATLAWALAAAAQAQEWVLGGITSESAQAVDLASVRTSGDLRSGWVLLVFAETDLSGAEPVVYIMMRATFDCFNSRFRMVSMSLYRMGSEKPSDSFEAEGEWVYLEPGASGEDTWNVVCTNDRTNAFNIQSAADLAPVMRAALIEVYGN